MWKFGKGNLEGVAEGRIWSDENEVNVEHRFLRFGIRKMSAAVRVL
jgi:hypothetical protein